VPRFLTYRVYDALHVSFRAIDADGFVVSPPPSSPSSSSSSVALAPAVSSRAAAAAAPPRRVASLASSSYASEAECTLQLLTDYDVDDVCARLGAVLGVDPWRLQLTRYSRVRI
jgi:hypothetical protein